MCSSVSFLNEHVLGTSVDEQLWLLSKAAETT